ncbi:MAG: hypothetical protein C3F08_03925 [Candidatus Methylomirabilota bacterium]|nr:MAG: hypothetical protein C3F08_03925 [candidate division NC10 bacterium]
MGNMIKLIFVAGAGFLAACPVTQQAVSNGQTGVKQISCGGKTYALYPAIFKERPDIPSPYRAEDGLEVLTARTEQNDYALVPVTITPGIALCPWEAPLEIDQEDFSALARTGVHSEAELELTRSITGRSVAEITELGRPGRLSSSGFMAEDEDILSVIKGDNRLVAKLGLTHAEVARPLLHVCNLIRALYLETGARHTNIVFYAGKRLTLQVEFSRGGQKSIFQDSLDGAWTIKIRRDFEEKEQAFLNRAYARLDPAQRETLVERLTEMLTGEMQPFYIYRYGFYEGHTAWRTDPVVIAFLFGLKSIEEIEAVFAGQLHRVLTQHFVCDSQ